MLVPSYLHSWPSETAWEIDANGTVVNACGSLGSGGGGGGSSPSSSPSGGGFGTASKLAFGQQPTQVGTGQTITPAVTVDIEDSNGNLVTSGTGSNASVTITLSGGMGSLGGTTTEAASGGAATFSNLTVSAAGTTYVLTAKSGTLTSAISSQFTVISCSGPDTFAVGVNPSTTNAGSSTTVTLTADKACGGTDTGYTSFHTITWSGASSVGSWYPQYPTGNVTFSGGASTTTLTATLYAAGSNTLTASASGGITGSTTVKVNAGIAQTDSLAFTGSALLYGCYFFDYFDYCANASSITADASLYDQYGNVASGTISLSIDGNGTLTPTSVSSGSPFTATIKSGHNSTTVTATYNSHSITLDLYSY